jgi:hypothetical protein
MKATSTRRRFFSRVAAAGAGLTILRPSASAWSYQANERLNLAQVGLSVRGGGTLVHSFS